MSLSSHGLRPLGVWGTPFEVGVQKPLSESIFICTQASLTSFRIDFGSLQARSSRLRPRESTQEAIYEDHDAVSRDQKKECRQSE